MEDSRYSYLLKLKKFKYDALLRLNKLNIIYKIALIVILFLFILAFLIYGLQQDAFEKVQEDIESKVEKPVSSSAIAPVKTSKPNSIPTSSLPVINYTAFEKNLANNPLINSIPSETKIGLKTYNFNAGNRVWEKSYTLQKGSVSAGEPTEADVTIVLHSKYVNKITNTNFCEIIKQAKENNDLGIWTDLSALQLTWKFKSMMEYKDCLGL
jgi:hypothetical protein